MCYNNFQPRQAIRQAYAFATAPRPTADRGRQFWQNAGKLDPDALAICG